MTLVSPSCRVPCRRRLAGVERGSRVSQMELNRRCERVRATEHAPRDPFRGLERRYCLAEIVECGAGVPVERRRKNPPQPKRDLRILSEDPSRDG